MPNNDEFKIAVLPDSISRAISLFVQYEINGSIIITYEIKPPIKLQVPNSSGVRFLVIIKIKIIPVITVINPIARPINPEYVTRTSDIPNISLKNYF